MDELLLLLLLLLLLPWFGPERRAGRTVGRAGGAAGFAFGGNGARKLSKAERGTKSEVAHKWANWLPHPCRIGEPLRCRAGDKIRSGPQVGKLATSPLPYRGAPPLQSGGLNQKWPTKWARWLPHPCRIGEPHRCRAGDKIRSGPQVGKLATSPLPYRGAPPLQSGGLNQKWPTK